MQPYVFSRPTTPRWLWWFVRPLWVRRVRRVKAQTFLPRWEAACARLWLKLEQRPPSLEAFLWFERYHSRLMRVCDNETKRIAQRGYL